MRTLLRADELARAQRYHQLADQQRFVVARAALRSILGQYLACAPAAIQFVVGPNKKPAIQNEPGLHYNVSHSKDWILIAVSAAPVGVDVEAIDPLFPFQDILPHSFSLPERQAIMSSPDGAHLFYQLWTRKEAFVKATARGIDDEFSTIPALDGPHRLAAASGQLVPSWLVSSFTVADGYVGAVAYQPSAHAVVPSFYNLTISEIDN
ncbi:4'-phosphopantetheinyl transferase family protein [Hymenobacter ginkgonis]|uniref:4'-phosphopantetheinyl transferase family protein n=1 Tax=Hymenobacter ginkgonis TaxID=2682976 RepID=UPI0018DBFA26|nr:4'-phosphopantetheinyl transferase superfamily protein [Hymenobacter ginkgonis]